MQIYLCTHLNFFSETIAYSLSFRKHSTDLQINGLVSMKEFNPFQANVTFSENIRKPKVGQRWFKK